MHKIIETKLVTDRRIHNTTKKNKEQKNKKQNEEHEFFPDNRKYKNVIENEVKLLGQITVEVENEGIRKNLNILIPEWEDLKPLLDTDWVRDFIQKIQDVETTTNATDQSEIKRKNNKVQKVIQNESNDKRHQD